MKVLWPPLTGTRGSPRALPKKRPSPRLSHVALLGGILTFFVPFPTEGAWGGGGDAGSQPISGPPHDTAAIASRFCALSQRLSQGSSAYRVP